MKRTLEVPLLQTRQEFEVLFSIVLETDFMVGNVITAPEPDEMNARICQKLLEVDEKTYAAIASTVPETNPRSPERVALYEKYMRNEDDTTLPERASLHCIAIINAVIAKYNAMIVK